MCVVVTERIWLVSWCRTDIPRNFLRTPCCRDPNYRIALTPDPWQTACGVLRRRVCELVRDCEVLYEGSERDEGDED